MVKRRPQFFLFQKNWYCVLLYLPSEPWHDLVIIYFNSLWDLFLWKLHFYLLLCNVTKILHWPFRTPVQVCTQRRDGEQNVWCIVIPASFMASPVRVAWSIPTFVNGQSLKKPWGPVFRDGTVFGMFKSFLIYLPTIC